MVGSGPRPGPDLRRKSTDSPPAGSGVDVRVILGKRNNLNNTRILSKKNLKPKHRCLVKQVTPL